MKKTIQPHVLGVGHPKKVRNPLLRFLSSQRFLTLVGLFFLLAIIFPLARIYTQKKQIEKEIAGVQSQINEYEQGNQELADMVTYLQSDQSLEEQARTTLNLKKPGENVVVIQKASSTPAGVEANKNAVSESNFAKWRRYFFD